MTKVLHAQSLWIRVESSLRAGAGEAGSVDLTIAREAHTGWPFIPAPTLKGLLHATLEEADAALAAAAFGSLQSRGLVSCADARVAALTVRSLKGVMAWVTAPAVIERLERDLAIGGLEGPADVEPVIGDAALCQEQSPLLERGSLLLEGMAFARTGNLPPGVADLLKPCAQSLGAGFDPSDRLVVVSDRAFGYFARHTLPAVTRVKLQYETKNVEPRHLFSQETVPPDTIFCGVVSYDSTRRDSRPQSQAARAWLGTLDGAVVQIGAGASVGLGICELAVRGPSM